MRLYARTRRRIQDSEIRLVTSGLWVFRRDRLWNDDIRNGLRIYNLNDSIKQYKQDWVDHVQTMHQNRLPKKLMFYHPRGNHSISRQRKGRPINECEMDWDVYKRQRLWQVCQFFFVHEQARRVQQEYYFLFFSCQKALIRTLCAALQSVWGATCVGRLDISISD